MNLNWSICRFFTERPEEVREKEFVKVMYIDEPEILDVAIKESQKNFGIVSRWSNQLLFI